MNTKLITFGLLVVSGVCAMAATRYVVPPGGSGTPVSPYASWEDAATNLQAAVVGAGAGDTILVTNGVYLLESEVTVGNLTIKSYNGGAVDRDGTIIDGNNYAGKLLTNRCFTLNNVNALVEGFTITNGYAIGNGGGVNMTAGVLRNCLVTGNIATNGSGGGVWASGASSFVTNCDVIANVAKYAASGTAGGGGVKLASAASLWNSRIMFNNSPIYWTAGGGVNCDSGTLVANCMIVSNKVGVDFNPGGSTQILA